MPTSSDPAESSTTAATAFVAANTLSPRRMIVKSA